MTVFALSGTPTQNAIVQAALDACDFPFDRLAAGLQAQTGRTTIPVEWADLSSYGARGVRAAGEHDHEHDDEWGTGHPVSDPEARAQVLGLAWTNGRVQLEAGLEQNARLAQEVFLSEGAHMVDFFYMTDADRQGITDALHGGPAAEHGHGWFDVGPYETWAGEAFMGQFIASFAPSVGVTLTQFVHRPSAESSAAVRKLLLREPEAPEQPEPETDPLARFPYAELDAWAGKRRAWWPRYARAAADAYLAWR